MQLSEAVRRITNLVDERNITLYRLYLESGIELNQYIKCSKEYISKYFLNLHRKLKSVRKNVREIFIFYKLKPQA